MPQTSATGEWPRGGGGFSLIELLVVLALLALAFATVWLTPPGGAASLDREAGRLLDLARHARDEAVMANRATALRIDRSGVGFEQRRAGRWVAIDAPPHGRRAFPEGIAASWAGDAESVHIAFDALGATAPADVLLASAGQRRRIVFGPDGEGAVHAAP